MEAKTLEERTIAAQKMVRLETERLGIPGIPLYVKETGSSNCVALYNNEENEIWYAPEHLTSQTAEEFLREFAKNVIMEWSIICWSEWTGIRKWRILLILKK